MKQKESLKYY